MSLNTLKLEMPSSALYASGNPSKISGVDGEDNESGPLFDCVLLHCVDENKEFSNEPFRTSKIEKKSILEDQDDFSDKKVSNHFNDQQKLMQGYSEGESTEKNFLHSSFENPLNDSSCLLEYLSISQRNSIEDPSHLNEKLSPFSNRENFFYKGSIDELSVKEENNIKDRLALKLEKNEDLSLDREEKCINESSRSYRNAEVFFSQFSNEGRYKSNNVESLNENERIQLNEFYPYENESSLRKDLNLMSEDFQSTQGLILSNSINFSEKESMRQKDAISAEGIIDQDHSESISLKKIKMMKKEMNGLNSETLRARPSEENLEAYLSSENKFNENPSLIKIETSMNEGEKQFTENPEKISSISPLILNASSTSVSLSDTLKGRNGFESDINSQSNTQGNANIATYSELALSEAANSSRATISSVELPSQYNSLTLRQLKPAILQHLAYLEANRPASVSLLLMSDAGDNIEMMLKLTQSGKLQVNFSSSADRYKSDLINQWDELSDHIHQKGWVLDGPHFEGIKTKQLVNTSNEQTSIKNNKNAQLQLASHAVHNSPIHRKSGSKPMARMKWDKLSETLSSQFA